MARRALIIGIDGYASEAWRLGGAVRDALAFTEWAVTAGGVAPADLRLLLSPAPGEPPPPVPAGAPAPVAATQQAIADALADLAELPADQGGDRLYVYFAGHGAALASRKTEPILVPVDFVNPRRHGQLLIGFSQVMPAVAEAPFKEQLFFLDACRDFAVEDYEPPLVSPVGAYRPTEGTARQYVLYSVAPGQRALDLGVGVWTAALLSGLKGESYRPVEERRGRYEVRLDRLAEWVRSEVTARIRKAFLREAARFVQTPEYVPSPQGGDPVLASFTRDTVPRASVSVFVEPALAHASCTISVMEYSSGLGDEIEVTASPPPPFALPVEFQLRPADYSFRARADRFSLISKPWTVDDDPLVELELSPEMEPPPPPPPPPALEPPRAPRPARPSAMEIAEGPSWRRMGMDDESAPRRRGWGDDMATAYEVSPFPDPNSPLAAWEAEATAAPAPAPAAGTLTVHCRDPYLRIKLLDSRKREVAERLSLGTPLDLNPGIYRLRCWMPGGHPVEKTVEVRPGAPTEVSLSVPPQLGDFQVHLLQGRGIGTDTEAGKLAYLSPSEILDPVTGLRFSSLLVYAAYAAHQPGPNFNKLRSLGVPPLAVREGEGGVTVLAGVAGGDRTPTEIAEFLAGCRAALVGEEAADAFTVLPGLPAAAAWQTAAGRPGSRVLELRLPGFGATRYAVAPLPGRIAVLAVSLEPDGSVDVQQLLVPLPGGPRLDRDLLAGKPENIRIVDLALRAWAAHEKKPLRGRDLEALLAGEWIDPLLACVAGYSLVRAGEPERFVGGKKGPLARLLHLFPELPDAWILAGLCDPVGESAGFEKAAACGIPVFAEGLRALAAGTEGPHPPVLAEALAGLLPASSWSAWASPIPKEEAP
ncbi:MAG: caspase family protein [Thermoanaerobaculia bacterium]